MLLCAVTLGAGYANKVRCVGPSFDSQGRSSPDYTIRIDRDVCYSDIQYLWIGRDVNRHLFPYVSGGYDPATEQLYGGAVEYPVLTGMAIYLAALPSSTDGDFLVYSAVLLAIAGLLSAALLAWLAGLRSWWFALAPPLVLYAFHNWDLFAVCATVIACWALLRASRRAGNEADRYPGAEGPAGDGPGAGRTRPARARWLVAAAFAGGTAAVFLLINLPFMVAGWAGWWASFQFQWSRPIDLTTNTIWFWAARPYSNSDNVAVQHDLAMAATVSPLGALLLACVLGWLRFGRDRGYPWLPVCAAMVCGYLLFNKVHSPQFALWLLPFFVLLRIRPGWICAYFVADAAIGIGFFRTQYLINSGLPSDSYDALSPQLVLIGVWGRVALLVALVVVFLRAEVVTIPSDTPIPT